MTYGTDYVQTKVSRANSVLNITRRVSNATNKIEQRLKANIDVMLPLTFIPKVGKLVKVIRKGVQIVHRKIKPVNRTLKKADKTIAPYRKGPGNPMDTSIDPRPSHET